MHLSYVVSGTVYEAIVLGVITVRTYYVPLMTIDTAASGPNLLITVDRDIDLNAMYLDTLPYDASQTRFSAVPVVEPLL